MWHSRPVRIIWHSFNWLTRIAIVLAVSALLLLAASILLLRYWLLPNIEQYHSTITQQLSLLMARPVTIEKISADWQGLRPRLTLLKFTVLDAQQQPALVLPKVTASLSWWSVLTAELRLANLEIERPELLIRRDAKGQMQVGGLAIDSHSSADSSAADWLLHQSRLVVRDALIVWVDESRRAPPLVMEHVNLRMENFWHHHRIALRATVPSELASPLDVRGDFSGASFADLTAWRGQLFSQLQYADLTAWRAWLDLPPELSSGHGALRAWLDIANGNVAKLKVDLAVRDVATKLADDVPEMSLRSLNGRVIWQQIDNGFELSTQGLNLRLASGLVVPNTDLSLRIANQTEAQPASGELRANLLQLETLGNLANFVPIPKDLRTQLDAYAPRGKVSNLTLQWQRNKQATPTFKVQAQLHNMALQQVGKLPGFSGLSGEISGDQVSGSVSVDAKKLRVDAPGFMREAVVFDSLKGKATWAHQGDELEVKFSEVQASNADLDGQTFGSYRTLKDTPGVLDLTVNMQRANIAQAAHYIPLIALNRTANDWLHTALQGGTSDDVQIRILGNLRDFPFTDASLGKFDVSAAIHNGALRFAPDWPVLDSIQGRLHLHDKVLEVTADSARSVGVAVSKVAVKIPDFTQSKLALEVAVQAAAPTQKFLAYAAQSPVRDFAHGFTDDIHALGDSSLNLQLRLPSLGEKLAEVTGSYRLNNNQVDLGGAIPLLRHASGELKFNEHGFNTEQMRAEILGGAANLEVHSTPQGTVLGKFNGTVEIAGLRANYAQPALQFLQGSTAWDAQLSTSSEGVQVAIQSSLQGLSSSLPVPLTKTAESALPLVVQIHASPSQKIKAQLIPAQQNISVALGTLFSARARLSKQNGHAVVQRAAVNFANRAAWPDADGVWLVGDIPELSVQGWEALLGASASDAAAPSVVFAGADVQVGKLTGYGYTLNDLHLKAQPRGADIAAQITSRVVTGEVIWQAKHADNSAKLRAHLQKLHWQNRQPVQDSVAQSAVPASSTTTAPIDPSQLPALDVTIDDLKFSGKSLGQLEIIGHPDGADWRLRRLLLSNPDGNLSGEGAWLGGALPATNIKLQLTLADTGKILERSGFPGTLKDGSGKLTAHLAWTGAPQAFNLASLQGALRLDTGKGQFIKADYNVAKLLSVLSLQALPKHIGLDFTDVFSEGFQFDKISGDASIDKGNLTTNNFVIDGSAAKVFMRGVVDLNQETQNLRVEILPSVGSGVSILTAFAAGPVVGVSAFVIDKLLGNVLDKLVSFEYNMTGTWAAPSFVKVGEKVVPVLPSAVPPVLQKVAPPAVAKP
ncbi:MAG: YhdP family protein [Sideroxydans sp.]|nr:YhdP family protein [Sideroxydans sp.]